MPLDGPTEDVLEHVSVKGEGTELVLEQADADYPVWERGMDFIVSALCNY